MYAQPCTFNDVIERTTYSISYKKYNAELDMLAVLNYKKTDFYGFIGVNRKRLRITFTSIKKSEENKDVYEVEGFSTVMNKNKRTFKGTFSLQSHYKFTEPTFEEPLKNGDIEGFSTFSYQLTEDEKLSATGIFKGKVLLCWAISNKGNLEYNDFYEGADPYFNNAFIGTWTSKQTQKTQQVSWAHLRVPCSGDLDIGAGEFIPNKKYLKYGWDEFINEMKAQYPGYAPYN